MSVPEVGLRAVLAEITDPDGGTIGLRTDRAYRSAFDDLARNAHPAGSTPTWRTDSSKTLDSIMTALSLKPG